MPLFEDIDEDRDNVSKENNHSCFNKAKERAKSFVKYMGQAFYQGFCAPFYSISSLKASWDISPSLQNVVKGSAKLNGIYALKAFGLYTFYYRAFSPLVNYFASNSNFSMVILKPTDWALYLTINGYLLLFEMPFKFLENATMIDTITDAAREAERDVQREAEVKAAGGTSEIKFCGCSDTLAATHSLVFYAVNRYGINTISYYINREYPNFCGKLTAFLLESFSFGYPLVEYKLDAVGTCTKHRLQALMLNNKAYFISFGASFVSVMWFINYVSKNIAGNEGNIFFYDALFSFLFQIYASIAISRKEKFPGGKEQHIDIFIFLKYLSETRAPQFIYSLLKKRYSLESIATSEGIGMWVLRRETQIMKWLKTCKGYLETFEKVRDNKWLEWMIKPFFVIPPEVKSYNDYIHSKLKDSEKYIELARDTEYRREILQSVSKDDKTQNVNDHNPDDMISRETDSDDEWEDIVEVLRGGERKSEHKEEKPQPLNSEFNDKHFVYRKNTTAPIQNDPWFIVESNKPLTRSGSHLFRRRTPLSENTRKILKEAVKQKKDLVGLTGMLITAPHLGPVKR